MKKGSGNVEQESTAKANNAEESGAAIPQQPKDKAHCFCPLLAKEHGEETAVVLQGLGYKIAKSKKVLDGRKWHYDTLEALEKRWPYLSDSGIGGMLDRQAAKNNVFKDGYNKASFDRTNWYSMTDALVSRALEKDGKLWFDVHAAVRCRSIIGGTLYQNLRYHLLLFLADHPEFTGTPYCKINKAALARVLPWSLSTIKREYKELIKAGLIVAKSKRSKEHTITNAADLVVPNGMKKHLHANKSVSSMEMGIGSSMEMTGSSTEQIGSSTEQNGSSTENYTHYKPFERHIHKHHSPAAAPAVCGVDVDAADAAVHSDISKSSATVPVKENPTLGISSLPQDIKDIQARIQSLRTKHRDTSDIVPPDYPQELAMQLVTDSRLSFSALETGWTSIVPAPIIRAVSPLLLQICTEYAVGEQWTNDQSELVFYEALEIVTSAFLLNTVDATILEPQFHHIEEEVWNTYDVIPYREERTDAPAEAKARLLIADIKKHNQEGWPTLNDDGTTTYIIATSKRLEKTAVGFFQENAEFTSHNVWEMLASCVRKFTMEPAVGGFDKYWYSRKGVDPTFLFKNWNRIKAERGA